MSSIRFGGPVGLHEHLLKFTAQSPSQIKCQEETYTIHHTQYASFDLRDAFITLVEETDSDPRTVDSTEVAQEFRQAIKHSDVCFTDKDLYYQYNSREYIKPRDLESVVFDYSMAHTNKEERGEIGYSLTPHANSQRESIAEILTLLNAEEAHREGCLEFTHNSPFTGDDEEDNKPDANVNTKEVGYAFRDLTLTNHGPSALRQPDPSLSTIREIYDIYTEIGMVPRVRQVYGLFVSPLPQRYYEKGDASQQRVQRAVSDIGRSAAGMGEDHTQKWTSISEPPLESLASYSNSANTDQQK